MKRKKLQPFWKQIRLRIYLWVAAVLCAVVAGAFILEAVYLSYQPSSPSTSPIATQTMPEDEDMPTASGDWPTYLADNGHSGFDADETIITPTTAPKLELKWAHTAGGSIASQPIVAHGVIYWGSWDGFEYATNLNNQVIWKTNLGKTSAPGCSPSSIGVSSTATIASVPIKGTNTLVDFVGGGKGNLYALDAHNGAIVWKKSLGAPPEA